MNQRTERQRGIGLIEIVITILIVSISMLGSISLQLSSKRLGFEAGQRSQASNLAQDLIERMRSNSSALDSYALNWKSGTTAPASNQDCLANNCISTDLAGYDLAQWVSELQGVSETRELIDGDGAVQTGGLQQASVCVTNSDGFVSVAVAWRGFQALSDPGLDTCGDDSGLYGSDNEYRQVLSFSSYIGEL